MKYQSDYKKVFAKSSVLLPFQTISMYEGVNSNKYEYAKQVEILRSKPKIVFTPIKNLLEKFPEEKMIELKGSLEKLENSMAEIVEFNI